MKAKIVSNPAVASVQGNMLVFSGLEQSSMLGTSQTSLWQERALGGRQEPPDTEPRTRLCAAIQLLRARAGGGEGGVQAASVPIFHGRYKELDPSTDLFSFPGRKMHKGTQGKKQKLPFCTQKAKQKHK